MFSFLSDIKERVETFLLTPKDDDIVKVYSKCFRICENGDVYDCELPTDISLQWENAVSKEINGEFYVISSDSGSRNERFGFLSKFQKDFYMKGVDFKVIGRDGQLELHRFLFENRKKTDSLQYVAEKCSIIAKAIGMSGSYGDDYSEEFFEKSIKMVLEKEPDPLRVYNSKGEIANEQ